MSDWEDVEDDGGWEDVSPSYSTPTPLAVVAEPEAAPSYIDSFLTGVKRTPQAVVDTVAAIPSGLKNIYDSVTSPVESLQDGTTEATIRGVGGLGAGLAGAGQGALLGSALGPVGTVLGGASGGALGLMGFDWLNELLGNDEATSLASKLHKADENFGTGLTLGAVAKGVQKTAQTITKGAPKVANQIDRSSLGARQSDYGSSSDFRTIDMPDGTSQTFVKAALNDLVENGKLGTSRNPAVLNKLVDTKAGALAQDIAQAIDDFDSAGVPVKPDFSGSRAYLASGNVPADLVKSYGARLSRIENGIDQASGGKLAYLQRQKVALGKSWNPADEVKSSFDRQLYRDLKTTIEANVPEIQGLNSELAKYQVVKPIIARSLKASEASSPLKTAGSIAYTTGGVGAPMLAGTALAGPVGTALGFGVGVAGKVAMSPSGQAAIARALRASARGASSIGEVPPAVTGAIQSQGQKRSKTKDIKASEPVQSSKLMDMLVSPANAEEPSAMDKMVSEKPRARDVSAVEQEIDADPYYSALYEAESSRNPRATNANSTAKGAFQFIDKTAKAVGLKDPFDLSQSFDAVQKLTETHAQKLGTEKPEILYAAHFLGESLLRKVLNNAKLSKEEQKLVDDLEQNALPRYMRIYNSKVA